MLNSEKVYPEEDLNLTSEIHLLCQPLPLPVIYLTMVLSLIIGALLLPFIFIDVSIKSPGILRPTTEVATLKSSSSGVVKAVLVKENAPVREGQLLVDVRSPLLEEKIRFLQRKVAEANTFLKDVQELIYFKSSATNSTRDSAPVWSPVTPLYRQSLADYDKKMVERKTQFLKVKCDYERNSQLYIQRVIPQVEYESFKFELDKAVAELDLLTESQLSAWQQDRRSYEKEAADFQTQLTQAQQEEENLKIKAPIQGTLQNLASIYPGSPVFISQSLAEISPDTDLLAEIHVSPGDIGLLHEGMVVRMQIQAFNYNQWGLLTGKVSEISNDIQLARGRPIFKVKCALDQNYLKLKSGYQGKVKKGMTLQARFMVTKRSLWQLLYDKVDDWANPNIKNY